MRFSTFITAFVLGFFLAACVKASPAVSTPTSGYPAYTPEVVEMQPQATYPAFEVPTYNPPETEFPDLAASVDAQTKGAATDAAEQALAQSTGVPMDQIEVVSVESVTWSDTCMEVPTFTNCQSFQVPGFRIVLHATDQTFEYHTNIDGTSLGLAFTQP